MNTHNRYNVATLGEQLATKMVLTQHQHQAAFVELVHEGCVAPLTEEAWRQAESCLRPISGTQDGVHCTLQQ